MLRRKIFKNIIKSLDNVRAGVYNIIKEKKKIKGGLYEWHTLEKPSIAGTSWAITATAGNVNVANTPGKKRCND